jgi:peptide/nickel transport system substrate-binding protein
MWLIFLPLVFMDAEGQAHPGLLERWEHSDDYTEWTLHLRKDVKWGDGVPVTAKDVKFTLELITNPELWWEQKVFDKITIIDDTTCLLSNNRPFSALLYRAGGIYPQHLLGDLKIADIYYWEFWNQPVGNGPYRYLRHVPKTMVELEYNPDYFGEKPNIERIIFKFGDNWITELLSGNVDVALEIPSLEVIKLGKDPRFNIYYEFNVTNAFTIIWNHKNPLFSDPDVRRALTLALNRKELIQVLNMPDSTPLFDTIITDGQFYRGEVPTPLPYDPEQAKKILDAEGWVLTNNNNGVREQNGREFRFSLLVSEDLLTTAVYVKDQFRKVGVHMEIVPMELRFHVAKQNEGKFDAIMRGFQQFDPGWGFGGYDNPELKQLLYEAIHSVSFDEVDRIANKIAPIFQKDLPWLMLYPDVKFHIVHKRIRGLESPFRAHPTRFIHSLWIEEEDEK